jgi:hypothetical protein
LLLLLLVTAALSRRLLSGLWALLARRRLPIDINPHADKFKLQTNRRPPENAFERIWRIAGRDRRGSRYPKWEYRRAGSAGTSSLRHCPSSSAAAGWRVKRIRVFHVSTGNPPSAHANHSEKIPRARVVALNDSAEAHQSLSQMPVLLMRRRVGKYTQIIRPAEVIRRIEACYEGGAMAYDA